MGSDDADEDEGFLNEELVPFVLILGVLLFLFPEPATSTVGLVLVGIGIALWAFDIVP